MLLAGEQITHNNISTETAVIFQFDISVNHKVKSSFFNTLLLSD